MLDIQTKSRKNKTEHNRISHTAQHNTYINKKKINVFVTTCFSISMWNRKDTERSGNAHVILLARRHALFDKNNNNTPSNPGENIY